MNLDSKRRHDERINHAIKKANDLENHRRHKLKMDYLLVSKTRSLLFRMLQQIFFLLLILLVSAFVIYLGSQIILKIIGMNIDLCANCVLISVSF